jgi:hypothetical protein
VKVSTSLAPVKLFGPALFPPKGSTFETKDSGARVDYPSGFRRDTDVDKPRYDLIPLDALRRLAELMARGARKYGDNNWMLASGDVELQRFKASAFRHFVQWMNGEVDEDHMAAVVFNLFAYETRKDLREMEADDAREAQA